MAQGRAAALLVVAVLAGGATAGGASSSDAYWTATSRSGKEGFDETEAAFSSQKSAAIATAGVPLTLLNPNTSSRKGAVCLDGSPPGYHFEQGKGSGLNSWLVQLEGGGWCNNLRTCNYRKTTARGSSEFMQKLLPFMGILSNNRDLNPFFYNWNKVMVRYCDGASFSGDSQDEIAQLSFRGQRILLAVMEELMSRGMKFAKQALLSGCSAGGLAAIIHCDKFRSLFHTTTKVKCLSDAGFFLDAFDITNKSKTLSSLFEGVVKLQSYCFFPQNLVADVKTPMFILNAAYDAWQVQSSLAPPSVDPTGIWYKCTHDIGSCNDTQLKFLHVFRTQMLDALKVFRNSAQNGLFMNSCFAHCQSEKQELWFDANSPRINSKRIAEAVAEWYLDGNHTQHVDACPYPCDNTCRNLVFRQ